MVQQTGQNTTLEERLQDKRNEIGLVGVQLRFLRPDSGPSIAEHITSDWREVVIRIRRGLDLAPDGETKTYLRKISKTVKTPLEETVAIDLLYHGCGHRELPVYTAYGCPYTVEWHDKILDGIARALQEQGKAGQHVSDSNGNTQSIESYLADAFEDILNNVNARSHTRHAGQALFWNNAGLEGPDKKFSDFYEAFVKINLALWGLPSDKVLLKRFYKNAEKTQVAVDSFLNYVKVALQSEEISKLHMPINEDLFEKLFLKEGWREMAYQFAKVTAHLMAGAEGQQAMRLCFGRQVGSESPFDRQIKLPQTQEELAYGRYKAGDGPSLHSDPLLQLDALYRRISKAIPVETSSYTEASAMPIAYYGRRNLEPDEDVRPSRIKGVGFTDEGELTLRVSKHELSCPVTHKIHPQKFPKLRIALLDTSSSMTEAADGSANVGNTNFIPWGDNSKYHYALKGLYGVNNFLIQQGVSAYVGAEIITFGDVVRKTGRTLLGSDEERRALLKMPSGGTMIDAQAIAESTGERCFMISVSDGDILNWASQKDAFKKAISSADYCHLHIGQKNEFTSDIESWGVPVYYVSGDDKLSGLFIKVASSYYREGRFV